MAAARRLPIRFPLICALALCLPNAAFAAWPQSSVHSGLPIMPGFTLNIPLTAISDGAGGAFVLMADARLGSTDIYLQRITAQGTVAGGWPNGGVAVCTAPGTQVGYAMIADGAGGVIAAWHDERVSIANGDIYAQHLTSTGAIAAGWPVNGLAISTSPKNDFFPSVATDGAGGAFIVWDLQFGAGDIDVYGAHVTGAGGVVFDNALVAPGSAQKNAQAASDGLGGFYVVYNDSGAGNLDIRASRYNGAGVAQFSSAILCSAVGDQDAINILEDGSGGLWVAWEDRRAGIPFAVYSTHISATGAPTQGFIADGNPVCPSTGDELRPQLARDAADGVIVAWQDTRFSPNYATYAQHVGRGGSRLSPWPVGGAQITLNEEGQDLPYKLISDGAGGALATILHNTNAPDPNNRMDAYAQHVTATGAVAPHWLPGGTPVAEGPGQQFPYTAVPDTLGGMVVIWGDGDGVGVAQGWSQRIDRFGALGNAEPKLVSVKDVPSDQGGALKLTWDASYLDTNPAHDIGSYWIWRSTSIASALQAVRGGARWASAEADAQRADASVDAGARQAISGRLFKPAAAGYAWEYLDSQPANGLPRYAYTAATLADSSGSGLPYTTFMVEAHAAASAAYWASPADSGLSVDNVAPSAPAPFSGTYSSGTASMAWGASPQADVVGYRLHRGPNPGFVPGPSNFITQTASLSYPDPAGSIQYYKLAAIDAHGNLSPYALALPTSTVGVDDGPRVPLVLALHPVSPNPSRENATIAFDLPREERVALSVFDLAGRRVRALADGALPAGTHRIDWDGRDASGHVMGAGIYLITLEAQGRRLRERFVLVR